MELSHFVLVPLVMVVLVCHVTEGRRNHIPVPGRYRTDDQPPPELESDSELLRALEFLEKYERAKSGRDVDPAGYDTLPEVPHRVGFEAPVGGEYPYYNEIPVELEIGNELPPLKWDDEDDDADIDGEFDMEDLYPPRPDDLETNDIAVAEAVVNEYREYETRRQKELFDKIMRDVIAEKVLEQDEAENIADLLEEQDEEQQGLEDLAVIFGPSSSADASDVEAGVYEPQELELPLQFSASSEALEEVLEGFSSEPSDVTDDDEVKEEEDVFLSEAGLEALDKAERILQEGYGAEDESSDSIPDFDDASDINALLGGTGQSSSSDAGESVEEAKEEVLKDVIYKIVQDTLRRKLVESMLHEGDTESEGFMESFIENGGSSDDQEGESEINAEDGTSDDAKYDGLLDNLVTEIRDQVDKLSSKIIREIEADDEDTSRSDEQDEDDVDDESSEGFFDVESVADESSSAVEEIVGHIVRDDFDATSSSVSEAYGSQTISDEELINAIKEIVPVAQSKICPVLNYLVDDCSVIEGFRGLGADGYREAFTRPCNRHQICYTCSSSYSIPTNLCDEIYKAELLTLCNGDIECKQRAKYFWLAATNDRTAPGTSLSFCSDRCVLDYLLSD